MPFLGAVEESNLSVEAAFGKEQGQQQLTCIFCIIRVTISRQALSHTKNKLDFRGKLVRETIAAVFGHDGTHQERAIIRVDACKQDWVDVFLSLHKIQCVLRTDDLRCECAHEQSENKQRCKQAAVRHIPTSAEIYVDQAYDGLDNQE